MTTTIPAAASLFPPPSTAWREVVDPGEEALVRRFLETIEAQQRAVADRDGAPPRRGFHAKLHVGAEARFRVLPGLPDHARHGVFNHPRTFDAVVRFSNGHFSVQPDATKDPRGIAIKLMDVTGPTLHPGDPHAATQDFLATSHSVTSTVRDIRQFVAFIESAAHGKLQLPIRLARRVGVREALRIIGAVRRTVLKPDVPSMATEHYAGTAPIQFGPFAGKFTVRPAGGTAPAGTRTRTPDFLREELEDRLRAGDLRFDFVAQFFVDEARTPIEDTSVPWDPRVAPFVKLAELRIPRCDVTADAAARQTSRKVDALSFSPWHALADHRPLGSVMRARRAAYEASARFRRHAPEPSGLPL
jgi:hypothetical protein